MLYKSQTIRIYPTEEQKELFQKQFDLARFAYNQCVERFNRNERKPRLKELRDSFPWTREKDCLGYSVESGFYDFDRAVLMFMKLKSKGHGRPKFKSKRNTKQSFQKWKPMKTQKDQRYRLGRLLGYVDIDIKKDFRWDLSSLIKWTVIKHGNIYKINFMFGLPEEENIERKSNNSIGIDLGISDYITTSNGEKFNPPNLTNINNRIVKEQKRLNRKSKGSKNYRKQLSKLRKVHAKKTNVRKNWQHKVSRKIISENQVIKVETLKPSNMVKNRSLARAISDVSWSTFIEKIEYKSKWNNREFKKIPQFYPSSKTCSTCKKINKELTLSVRKWECDGCGKTHDRDINAAINILNYKTE